MDFYLVVTVRGALVEKKEADCQVQRGPKGEGLIVRKLPRE